MPAVGILKKPFGRRRSPPPPPPSSSIKPPIPPKPKRGIVLYRPGAAAPVPAVADPGDGVRLTDDEEPTTEESYDYKDIDFASDIFDFRVAPPRPRPPCPRPSPLQNGNAVRMVSDALELADAAELVVAVEDRVQDGPVPKEPGAEPDMAQDEEEDDDDDEFDETKSDDLAQFLAEHEGKELTLEDVRKLELLLDEVEKKESERGTEPEGAELREEAARAEEGKEAGERVLVVRFGIAEVLEDGVVLEEELQGGVSDDDQMDGEASPREDSDFGAVRFGNGGRVAELAIYEPVGQPDLRFVRPDLSGYVPPSPSPSVGDPFSWRRRGKRRHDDYGAAAAGKLPAMNKILNGCEQVERLIASRDLSPPGMLLDVLEPSPDQKSRRMKRKRAPPCRPPLPIPVPSPPTPEAGPGPGDGVPAHVEELDVDEERMTELESQILTDLTSVEGLIVPIDLKRETVVGATAAGGTVEPILQKESAYETGAGVASDADVPDEDAVCKAEVSSGLDLEDGAMAPKRMSRRDRPRRPFPPRFSPQPVRPERRKRVASADALLTAVARDEVGPEPPPRSKAQRSVSFHTAEEIRKKIDVQAQLFLRTPRRKDRSSPTYQSTCPSASASLVYGRTLRRPRPPLTPVYSHVHKDVARRKEAAAQTGEGEEMELLPPLPPREPAEDGAKSKPPGPADPAPPSEDFAEDSEVTPEFRSLSWSEPNGPKSKPPGRADSALLSEDSAEDSEVPPEFRGLSWSEPNGSKVPTRSEGPNGSKVPNGSEWPNGSKGPNGSKVPTGSKGMNGSEVPNGSKVPTGSEGPNGSKVPTGSEGLNGSKVPTGSDGLNGSKVPTGSEGLNGSKVPTGSEGLNGSKVLTGSEGLNGSKVPTGSEWLNGSKVPTGSEGLNGFKVPTGPEGPADGITVTQDPLLENGADGDPCVEGRSSLSPANRPLPPPPAPPRHRSAKNAPNAAAFTSGTPVVLCGILPSKGDSLTVVHDMKVLRLSVVQLDASILRVAQLEADHLFARRWDESASTPSPKPPPSDDCPQPHASPPPPAPLQDSRTTPDRDHGRPDGDGPKADVPPPGDGDRPDDVWEPGYFADRASPTTAASTTSGSASYVTCDETLREDSELTNAFDQCSMDGSFGFDDEEATAGCGTPTEMDVAVDDPDLGPFDCPATVFGCVLPTLPSDPSAVFTSSSSPSHSLRARLDSDAAAAAFSSPAMETDENCNVPSHQPPPVFRRDSPTQEGMAPAAPLPPPLWLERPQEAKEAADRTGTPLANGDQDPAPEPPQGETGLPFTEPVDMEEDDGDEMARNVVYRAKWSRTGIRRSLAKGSAPQRSASNPSPSAATKNRPKGAVSDSHVRRSHSKGSQNSSTFYLPSQEVLATPALPLLVKTPPPTPPKIAVQLEAPATVNGTQCDEKKNGISKGSVLSLALSSEDEDDDSDAVSHRSLDSARSQRSESERKRSRAFNVANEMMTSERVFVGVLRLLTQDFPRALEEAGRRSHVQSVVPQDVLEQILDSLPQLQQLNELLLRDLEERIEKWEVCGRIADIIVRHGPFLKLYASYIKKYSLLESTLNDARKKYPHFAEAANNFEMSDRCKNLKLHHYMLKPVQRIPQYRLLLQDYLKCIDESSPDYESTQTALHIVSDVADHANEAIKHVEKFEKLVEIQNRMVGSYQVIKPGRVFIKEGELSKLCRKGMQPRKFIMFSDCLFHCSVTSPNLLKVHHELPLTDMKVNVPLQDEYRNEFSIISVRRSFNLMAASADERDEWIRALNTAIEETTIRLCTFMQAKLHKQNVSIDRHGADALGKKAPVWVPDSRVTMCQLCAREFSLTFRRHHCRACGKVFCALCSANRAPLQYTGYEVRRVCDECFIVLQNEIAEKEECGLDQVKCAESEEWVADDDEGGGDKKKLSSRSLRDLKAQFKKFHVNSAGPQKPYLPSVLKEVCANDAGSSMSGYLFLKTKRVWKKQWFVVKDKVLYSYKASENVAALNTTPLLGFKLVTFSKGQEGISPELLFELSHAGHPSMQFYAENQQSAARWIEAMRQATVLE